MVTFIIGLLILFFGYIFYSKYIEKQFLPEEKKVPSEELYNGIDYVPLSSKRNQLINLLNIAGMGPILSAIQGIVFGPIFFMQTRMGKFGKPFKMIKFRTMYQDKVDESFDDVVFSPEKTKDFLFDLSVSSCQKI